MWPTVNDPFCWFRFGSCGADPASASDTAVPMAEEGSQAAAGAAASEACGCPDTRDSWPFRAVLTGDFASTFDSGLLTHTIVAATIGAVCASFLLYLSWRQRRPAPAEDGGGPRRRRDTGDSTWATDDPDPYLPAEGKYAKPQRHVREAPVLDYMSEGNLSREVYAGMKPEKQDPAFTARRFDGILRQDSHSRSPPGPSFYSYSDLDMPAKKQSHSSSQQLQRVRRSECGFIPSSVTSAAQASVISSMVSIGTQCSGVMTSTATTEGLNPYDDGPSLSQQQRQLQQEQRTVLPVTVKMKTLSAPSLHAIQNTNPFISASDRPSPPARPRDSNTGLELHQYPRDGHTPCSDPCGMTLESTLRLFKTPYALVQDCSPINVNGPWLVFRCDPSTQLKSQSQSTLRIDGKSEHLIGFLHENCPGSRDAIVSTQVEDRKKVPMHFISTMVQCQLAPSLHRWRSFQESMEESPDDLHEPTDKLTYVTHARAQTKLDLHRGLVSLSAALDTKPYFVGQSITTIDCRVFGSLCQMVWTKPAWYELQELIREFPNLVAYCHRVRSILWPDWDSQLKRTPSTWATTSTPTRPSPTPTSAPLLGLSPSPAHPSPVPTQRYKWTTTKAD